jgi:hypothetical protein
MGDVGGDDGQNLLGRSTMEACVVGTEDEVVVLFVVRVAARAWNGLRRD